MKTTLAPLLATLLLAGCAGDVVTPADLGIEVDLPVTRIADTHGWRNEPELLVLQYGETTRAPTDEEIDATSENAAFLLCLESGLDAWPGIRAAFAGAIFHGRPRVYLAARDTASTVTALPMVVNRDLEDELRRASAFLFPMDAGPEGAFELRITRAGDDVRYRWRRLGTDEEIRWDLGDVTLKTAESTAESSPPIPGLAKTLQERKLVNGERSALVAFELGRGVLPEDLLRAMACARGSTEVHFVPVMALHPDLETLKIRLPDPEEGAGGVTEGGSGRGWRTVLLGIANMKGNPRLGQPEFRFEGIAYESAPEIPLPEPPPPGLHLVVDVTMPWKLCAPLIAWATEKKLGLSFALSKEDPNFFRERSIEIPLGRGDGATILAIPAGAKAGSVIRDAHRMVANGATEIEFVLER